MSQIQIPKGWEFKTLSEVCIINPSKSEIKELPNETKVSFIPMRYVDGKKGVIVTMDTKNLGEVRKGFTYFKEGDVLFAKITPCMQNGKSAVGVGLVGTIGFASTEFHVLRPKNEVISEWIHYFVRNQPFRTEAAKYFTGSAGQQRVPKEFLESHQIPIPPKIIQKKIVQKLDYIFEQLEEKKKIIFQYQQKNKILLTHIKENILLSLISKLIPKDNLKDGWTLQKLSEVCQVERGKFGHRPRNDPAFYSGKYPFIQTGDVARSNGRIRKYHQTLNEKGLKVSRMFPKGTVVITIAANIGDTAILEFDSCFPDSLIGITPFKNKAIPEYLEYVLRLFQYELNRDASQGAQKNINYGFLKPLKIPIPPKLEIQKNLVEKIQKSEVELNEVIMHLNSIIEKQNSFQKYLDSLQNSILDIAFLGKLVN